MDRETKLLNIKRQTQISEALLEAISRDPSLLLRDDFHPIAMRAVPDATKGEVAQAIDQIIARLKATRERLVEKGQKE